MPGETDAIIRREMKALAETLENSFYGLDRVAILEKIARRTETADQREELSEASGITDGRLLDLLVDLRITAESLSALALAPLVMVAWADGRVDAKERAAVVEAAREAGVRHGDLSDKLLEQRLGDRPDPVLVNAWKAYARLLARTLSPAELALLKSQMLDRARKVAEASRGRLGLGARISKAEREMIEDLEAAFG
jgi:tellurite resistance protein